VTLSEIEDRWSLDTLLDAHLAIDLWEELESKSAAKAQSDAQHQRPR
jgi:hypothetical protein